MLYFSIKLFSILIITIAIYYLLRKKEMFEHSIEFLSDSQCSDLIHSDTDGFIQSMSEVDIRARNANDKDHYKTIASGLCRSFSKDDKERIVRLVKSIKPVDLTSFGINMDKWNKIHLKFAFSEYEDQYPHTRGDVIIFNSRTLNRSDSDVINTIIHEKVHIYQKMYPNDVEKYLSSIGFVKMVPISAYPLGRLNPDTDRMVYKDGSGKVYIAEYNTSEPSGLWDINSSAEGEHPWEVMAYKIADIHTN